MCFSAPASFTLGSALIAIGTITISKIKTKKHLLIALIPLFFGIQQYSEGVLWLYSENPNYIATFSKNIFLFFAFFFWPIWIPLSLLVAETITSRKTAIAVFLGIGISIGGLLSLLIPSMRPQVYCSSIQYAFDPKLLSSITFLFLPGLVLIFYVLAVVTPLFISSLKWTKILGALIALSAIVILIIDRAFFTSMWCFFAALASLAIYYVLKEHKT